MQTPFDYQTETVEVAANRIREGKRRLMLTLPCGAGKTTVIALKALRAAAKGTRMLILAHRRKLIKQIAQRLLEFGVAFNVIMADLPAEPWARRDPGACITVASKDTLASRIESEGIPQVQVVIVDEAHLFGQKEYQRVVRLTGCTYIIGFTATPINGDGTGLGKHLWDSLDSIITIEKLIDRGRLCAMKTFGPVGLMERRKKGGRTSKAGDPVEQWQTFAQGMRTAVFSGSCNESRAVRDAYLKAGIPAIHIDAHTPEDGPDSREEAFAKTASGENLILCTVGLLKEGVDIPSLQCAQLLTKAVSPVVFWQNTGRCQRSNEGKDFGVLLDHAGATVIHGLPNTSPEWSLAEGDSTQAREAAKQSKDPSARPRMCKQCGAVSAGAGKCPECGALLIFSPKTETMTEREGLQEITGDNSAPGWDKKTAPQNEWHRMLFITAAQGKTCGVAAAMFKRKYGQWPNEAGVRPVPASDANHRLVKDVYPQFDRRRATA